MTYTLESDSLQVQINHQGIEICSIKNKQSGIEYLWQGDPSIWAGHAPVLFPIVGALKEGKTTHLGKEYKLDKHGFIRNSNKAQIITQKENRIVFQLVPDEEIMSSYPFDFVFEISFDLTGKSLKVSHRVKNVGKEPMYYSIGGHPAFNCPLSDGSSLEDYWLEFPELENDYTYQILPGGLIGEKSDHILNNSQKIQLHDHIFDGDALIFKHLKSRSITLHHIDRGPIVGMEFKDFDFLGIWAKPKAPYVCIEPWLGIGDSVSHSGLFIEKEGIRKLEPNQSEVKSFSIEVLE